MRISFDLDDTLICYQEGAAWEPNRVPWLLRGWFPEPLRLGARDLLRGLARHGWEVWIYTTSHRSPAGVFWWLRFHGIRVQRVINQDVHDAYLRRRGRDRSPSKNPAAFGIDLHVDDSEGVAMEGRQYGFEVVVVSPDDTSWSEKVLAVVERRKGPRG